MKRQDRDLLLGMLLGDGCLKPKHHIKLDGNPSTYYEYVLCHSVKQKEYLEYKLQLFHSIMGGKLPNLHYEKNKLGESLRFSRCHKYFRLLHRVLYSNNNKKLFTKLVLSRLNPHTLAIWYMDDGCLSMNPSRKSYEMRICTYFTENEADLCVDYFYTTWGITPKKRRYKKGDQFNLVFNTTESKKFEIIIEKYVISSMQYKLPSHRITRALDTPSG